MILRRLAILALLLLAGATAAALAQGSPRPRLLRYTDRLGWSLTYPRSFHLEQTTPNPAIGFYEVTVANFRPARGVVSWSYRGGGGSDLAPPAKPFPANGVTFRVWWFTDDPPFPGVAPDSRFPLRLSDFTEPAPFLSVRPGRALGIN